MNSCHSSEDEPRFAMATTSGTQGADATESENEFKDDVMDQIAATLDMEQFCAVVTPARASAKRKSEDSVDVLCNDDRKKPAFSNKNNTEEVPKVAHLLLLHPFFFSCSRIRGSLIQNILRFRVEVLLHALWRSRRAVVSTSPFRAIQLGLE